MTCADVASHMGNGCIVDEGEGAGARARTEEVCVRGELVARLTGIRIGAARRVACELKPLLCASLAVQPEANAELGGGLLLGGAGCAAGPARDQKRGGRGGEHHGGAQPPQPAGAQETTTDLMSRVEEPTLSKTTNETTFVPAVGNVCVVEGVATTVTVPSGQYHL